MVGDSQVETFSLLATRVCGGVGRRPSRSAPQTLEQVVPDVLVETPEELGRALTSERNANAVISVLLRAKFVHGNHIEVPDELAAEAQARGLKPEAYVEEIYTRQVPLHPCAAVPESRGNSRVARLVSAVFRQNPAVAEDHFPRVESIRTTD